MKKRLDLILKIGLTVIVALVIIGGLAAYFSFSYFHKCENFSCFQEAMQKCAKAEYINEELEASWKYDILGARGNECEVNVKLLLAKEGELGIDRLEGYEMSCFYDRGQGVYPEDDLSKCHGRLKEELQGIIINKLHTYVIENLGKIEEGIDKVV